MHPENIIQDKKNIKYEEKGQLLIKVIQILIKILLQQRQKFTPVCFPQPKLRKSLVVIP